MTPDEAIQPILEVPARVKGRSVFFDLGHNATELADWRTLRFTWWDVHETPIYFAATVAEGLGLRPARWKARKGY